MNVKALVTAIIAAAALTACAGMQTQQSRQFSHELGKQYTQISVNNEASSYKWDKPAYFAEKGARASAGDDVQPEQPATWNVPREYRPELKNAYDMLQIALIPDQKKVQKPVAAADAQAYFDCWVEQAHKHWVPNSHENDCRAAFYEAFCRMYNGKCSSSISSDHIFRLYFATGKDTITEQGRDVISKIAATYNKGGHEVIVAGHADRVGDNATNQKLSQARANAVKTKLIFAGVPARNITVKAFGKRMPLVQTPDNVPNANNRRVLVVVR